jgi:4'-phosphopantetheinyl transferase
MNPVWAKPPDDLFLGEGIVHIWFRDLHGGSDFGGADECLSADERVRAARFSNEQSRLIYVGSHIFLRQVLASYLRTDPALVRFGVDSNGKPYVTDSAVVGLEFNLSYAHLASACAITVGARIGIDVERTDTSLCDDATAELVFSPTELRRLAGWKGTEKSNAFFRGWTRKEAYAKCLGLGMSAPLKSIELDFGDREETVEGLTVRTFICPNRYVASVAVEGKQAVVKFWDSSEKNRSAGA